MSAQFNRMDITEKNINSRLKGWVKRSQRSAEELQSLIVFGMFHWDATGDSVYLTRVVHAVNQSKAVSGLAIQKYIMKHCPTIKWAELANGTEGFKTKRKGLKVVFIHPDVAWYQDDISKPAKANKEWQDEKALLRLVKDFQKHGVPVERITELLPVVIRQLDVDDAKKITGNHKVK